MNDYVEYLKNEYFEDLYNLPTNSAEYSIVQGELIEEIMDEDRGITGRSPASETEAMNVARYLNLGYIHEAEETVEQLLEE